MKPKSKIPSIALPVALGVLTAAICGRCERVGKILLNEKEWRQYQSGKTVFAFNNNTMKVKAKQATQIQDPSQLLTPDF